MSIKVKICGLTNYEDAKRALDLGADALGFNFYAKSRRSISVAEAQTIVRQLPPKAWMVGVFVNHSRKEVEQIARAVGLDTLQFHGDEDLDFCRGWNSWKVIKAVRVGTNTSAAALKDYLGVADYLLLDRDESGSYGGTGKEIDLNILESYMHDGILQRSFLAGGLTPANVSEKIKRFKPFAVDVASGVEIEPGKKDPTALRQFIDNARTALTR